MRVTPEFPPVKIFGGSETDKISRCINSSPNLSEYQMVSLEILSNWISYLKFCNNLEYLNSEKWVLFSNFQKFLIQFKTTVLNGSKRLNKPWTRYFGSNKTCAVKFKMPFHMVSIKHQLFATIWYGPYRLFPKNYKHSCSALTRVYIWKYENGEILIRNSKLFKFIQSGPLKGIFIWS